MYAKLMLCAVALFMACKVLAVQLTPQEALARMNSTQTQAKGVVSDDSSMQLVYTSTFKGNNTYYVFNKGNEDGFVILSADDSMPAVLADVEGASFDYDKIPENMKWWLSQYDYSIYSYATKGKKYVSAEAKTDIAPLLGGIAWNQNFPYNLKCPEYEGFNAFTGCVATAMAQIMRMHKWPKQGTGKCEYDCDFQYDYDYDNDTPLTKTITLSADLSKSTYQWDKMPETYLGLETMEQKLAVAQLMYDCGVASEMSYGLSGSGTYGENAVSALVKNFSYDTSICEERRCYYDDDVWENMVYENLSKGMPLIYVGATSNGAAHAFVCDGYKADDNMYHINWGWGGNENGYFLLTGNASQNDSSEPLNGFDYSQAAIFNIKPASTPYVEGSEGEFPLVVCEPYHFEVYDEKTQDFKKSDRLIRGISARARSEKSFLQYPGFIDHDYAIGVKFSNQSDEYIVTIYSKKMYPQKYMENVSDFYDMPKNGRYTVSFVYKDITAGNTEWKDAIYQPGVTMPEVEVIGSDPLCCLDEKPELIYNGKSVTDGIIDRVPGVDFATVKVKVRALKPLKDNSIWIFLTGCYHNIIKSGTNISLSDAEANTVQTVSYDIFISDCLSNKKGSIDFTIDYDTEYGHEVHDLTYDGKKMEFTIHDTPTGIETIPQAEEKAATETIYDIYGRKIGSMKKGGVYIVNGKKIIVK